MEIADLLPLIGDTAVIVVLVYVIYLFVDGKIFSAKSLEKITVAISAEMAARLETGIVMQFEALNVREQRILDAVLNIRDNDDIRDLLVELRGIKRITDAQIRHDQASAGESEGL